MANKRDNRRGALHTVGLTLGVALLVAMGLLGWRWTKSLHVERVNIVGAEYADLDALRELAQVDTGQVLFDLDPAIIADRVQRHPWVAAAQVRRLPTGTLAIGVEERAPVALVFDRRGRPAHYLDRDSFAMPLTPGAVYDVPLLRGVAEDYHPVRPVEDPTVRALLTALAAADEATDALISELELRDGDVWLYTVPAGARGAIPVRLGRGDFGPKLRRLHAFWHRAVLPQPEKTFQVIDLRFASQVVTREAVRGQ